MKKILYSMLLTSFLIVPVAVGMGTGGDNGDNGDNNKKIPAQCSLGMYDFLRAPGQILLLCFQERYGMTRHGDTALISAANSGNIDVVKFLLHLGANVNISNNNGWTPLHGAAICGNMEIVQLLLNRGANVNVQDSRGRTPLYWAAQNGHIGIVQLLLQAGANVNNTRDQCNGCTPLHVAMYGGRIEIVQMLLQAGAIIEIQNDEGYRPLHVAVYRGHLEIVRFLVAVADVDINARTREGGQTPLTIARHQGNGAMINYLIQHGAAE